MFLTGLLYRYRCQSLVGLLVFVTLRFIATLRERYDWSEADFENEWQLAHSNPKVVSLLTITTASSGRKLSSHAAVTTGRDVETDDVASTFSRCLSIHGSEGQL